MATVRRLKGPGRLPLPKNLKQYTPDGLVRLLDRFGMSPDLNALNAAGTRALERLDSLIDDGIEPDEAAWEDVKTRFNREVGAFLRKQVKTAIKGYRVAKLQAESGEGVKLTWVSVADENTCPSCEPRHGKTKTLRQWKRLGLPGSGALVCGKECRCSLHPE